MKKGLGSIGIGLCLVFLLLGASVPISAETLDGVTPAEETACTKYEGEGARYGLCIAYCEAQDCDLYKEDLSCQRIKDNFITYSKKKGYVEGNAKYGKTTIDCLELECNKEDIDYCGGKEIDCIDPTSKECISKCSSKYYGHDNGLPVCVKQGICLQCIKKEI